MLVLGAERGELPDGVEAARIPVHADSLNVAMAATVALHESCIGWPPMPDLVQLRAEGEEAIAAAATAALEELRVRLLGRKSELTATLRSIGDLPPEQRGPVGKQANEVRQALERLLAERTPELEASELDRRLAEDRIDVTLPGDPPLPSGPCTSSRRSARMEDIFLGLGF